MNKWYYAKDGERFGPVSAGVLGDLFDAGELAQSTLIWRKGMDEWHPAEEVNDLDLPPPPLPAATAPVAASTGATNEKRRMSQVRQEKDTSRPSVVSQGTRTANIYAGFWLRVGALLIDFILIFVVSFFATLVLAGLIGFEGAQVLVNLGGILGGWLYFVVMESSSRQATFGKQALGLKVTDLEGNRISFGKATGRHFGKILSAIILYIGFVMAGLTEKKQGLHDILAGCLVVRER